ncbi:MAG: transposase, partial [Desulfamplus sp.]|nr:transposase [Desulfamplus sp.]
FVTICTRKRECLFGNVSNGITRLNDAGKMVAQWFRELENKFMDVQCDAFVCMPNHIHFIVINVGADLRVCPESTWGEHIGSPLLQHIVQWFKTMTTNHYIRGVKQHGWQPFPGKLWQRNYWEHIVRNETECNSIREYIHSNPLQWELDQLHPNQPEYTDRLTSRAIPLRFTLHSHQ